MPHTKRGQSAFNSYHWDMLLRRAVTRIAAALWAGVVLATGGAMTVPAARADGAATATSAVVFAYNRFGEDQLPNSSIRLDQFDSHIEELQDGDYTVLPLPEILDAVQKNKPLPDRAVAITIDDATKQVYREAWPRLRTAGLPVTLFIATDPLDRAAPTHMSWAEVRQMANAGVTIGLLGSTTMSLLGRPLNEASAEIRRAADRAEAELGRRPTLLAWPQGEYSTALQDLVTTLGFTAALGLQSGVVHNGADDKALPRFVMNEAYGSIDRFRLAANALPLPVDDLTPDEPLLTVNPPPMGFTVVGDVGDLGRVACFAAGQGRMKLERIGDHRIEVRIAEPFPPGRTRVNCTMPVPDGRWRWFGVQFVVPEKP